MLYFECIPIAIDSGAYKEGWLANILHKRYTSPNWMCVCVAECIARLILMHNNILMLNFKANKNYGEIFHQSSSGKLAVSLMGQQQSADH